MHVFEALSDDRSLTAEMTYLISAFNNILMEVQSLTVYGDGGRITLWRWTVNTSRTHSVKTSYFNLRGQSFICNLQQLSSCQCLHTGEAV